MKQSKIIMEAIISGERKHPLEKVRCNGCGLMTARRDIEGTSGLCKAVCYLQYAEDMDRMYAKAESEHENYLTANY